MNFDEIIGLYGCLSVYLSVYLPICLSICLSVCLSWLAGFFLSVLSSSGFFSFIFGVQHIYPGGFGFVFLMLERVGCIRQVVTHNGERGLGAGTV